MKKILLVIITSCVLQSCATLVGLNKIPKMEKLNARTERFDFVKWEEGKNNYGLLKYYNIEGKRVYLYDEHGLYVKSIDDDVYEEARYYNAEGKLLYRGMSYVRNMSDCRVGKWEYYDSEGDLDHIEIGRAHV